MIKVIASDMDGTLLNGQHTISERTKNVIKLACEKGFRFMIITGRNFSGAWQELEDADLVCDYIVNSGAEIRNPQREVIRKINMDPQDCQFVNTIMERNSIRSMYCAQSCNYIIGTWEEVDQEILYYVSLFNRGLTKEELKKTKLYTKMWGRTKEIPSFDELMKQEKNLCKAFLVTEDVDKRLKIRKELERNPRLVVTSSSPNNLEITDKKAQKGPVLKEYIESLGYTMDEVLVLGDSLNDYSMMCMDFGATVAMANAHQDIKDVAAYITKSNEEDGVAYVIEELLKKYKMYH